MPQFDDKSIETIREVCRRVLNEIGITGPPPRPKQGVSYSAFLGQATEDGITAGTGFTPGSGTVYKWKKDLVTGDVTPVLDRNGARVTSPVLNAFTAHAGGVFMHCEVDRWGQVWVMRPGVSPPAMFFDPIVIHQATAAPAHAANEIRTGKNCGIFFADYINDPDASGVEYLWFDPVTDPANEWNDATFQINRTGLWRVDAMWELRPSTNSQWFPGTWGSISQDTGPATAGTAHTHTEETWNAGEETFSCSFFWRPSSGDAFDSKLPFQLRSIVSVPRSTSHGDIQTCNFVIANLIAGSQLSLRALSDANIGGSGAILRRMHIGFQYLGAPQPATLSPVSIGIDADAEDLPTAGAHTNNF